MLTRETFKGPWAGLPVAWTEDDRFDESTYRGDVARCCRAGVPGVYTGGTTGEFYAMELDEFREVVRATVEVCREHGTPVMIGCTSTYTLGSQRRAEMAVELGADAVQIALPYWMEIGETEIVPFFREASAAAADLPLSIYETTRSKRALTVAQHRNVKDAVPNYVMVKANAGTIGATAEGCRELSRFVSVFAGESRWADLGPNGVHGGCSSMVYWNPAFTLDFWARVEDRDWNSVNETHNRVQPLFDFLLHQFGGRRGFTDTAFDRLGAVACGFLTTSLRSRGPYPSVNPDDVGRLQTWCHANFPELLRQGGG